MAQLDIWFEFASTYSYLTVNRAERLLTQSGVSFAWRPFLLGPIFGDRGMTTSPFVLDPVRGNYMWRDVERRAARLGLPFRRPDRFPANGLLAARVMTAALDAPWSAAFARGVYDAQFARGLDISEPAVIKEVLRRCQAPPDDWLEKAGTDAVKTALRETTDQARSLGIFGAPSFTVGGEVFWGDDRLEDAIEWAVSPPPTPG